MTENQTLISLFLLLLIYINEVTCLQCYECQAKDDQRCNDPFTPADMNNIGGMSECSDDYTHCIKFKTLQYLSDSGYVTGTWRDVQVVSRFCVKRPGKKDGCFWKRSAGGFYFECLCSSDGCNSGRTIMPNLIAIIVAMLVAVFLSKRS